MKLLPFIAFGTLCHSAAIQCSPYKVVVPAAISTGNSVAQFVSGMGGLDGPKVRPINDIVFDWWYFDAVAADGLTSLVVTFFTSTSDAYVTTSSYTS